MTVFSLDVDVVLPGNLLHETGIPNGVVVDHVVTTWTQHDQVPVLAGQLRERGEWQDVVHLKLFFLAVLTARLAASVFVVPAVTQLPHAVRQVAAIMHGRSPPDPQLLATGVEVPAEDLHVDWFLVHTLECFDNKKLH